MRCTSLSLALVSALASPAASQVHSFFGSGQQERLGHDVAAAGDVNADGTPDIVVGGPYAILFGCDTGVRTGARVYSGSDGSVLHTFVTSNSDDHHGVQVRGAGDVDGDGFDDVLVANGSDFCCYGANDLFVYSGQTGAVIHHVQHIPWWYYFHKNDMDAVGDANGDGFDDFAVGDGGSDFVTVYSGLDASPLLHLTGAGPNFGASVAHVGDWDGDGVGDLAFSVDATSTRVVALPAGTVLLDVPFGGVIDDVGDFDGDGQRDLLIGGFYGELTHTAQARVVSGANGAVLQTYGGWTRYRTAGDYDGDGTVDLVVGDPTETMGRGRAALLSGADGTVLTLLHEGVERWAQVGYAVRAVGDVTGDGVVDVAVGAVGERANPGSGPYGGAVHVFSGPCPPAPANYCVGAPNSAGPGASIGFEGTWSVANADLVLTASGLPPHHFGIFFYGPGQTSVALGDGFRCVDGPPLFRMDILGSGAAGAVALEVDYGTHGGQLVAGTTWNFQFWYRDTPAMQAGFNLTDALAIGFCP